MIVLTRAVHLGLNYITVITFMKFTEDHYSALSFSRYGWPSARESLSSE